MNLKFKTDIISKIQSRMNPKTEVGWKSTEIRAVDGTRENALNALRRHGLFGSLYNLSDQGHTSRDCPDA